MAVARSWGRRNGELLFNVDRVSVLYDEMSFGDGWYLQLHNNVNVFKTTELYTKKCLEW